MQLSTVLGARNVDLELAGSHGSGFLVACWVLLDSFSHAATSKQCASFQT